MYPIPNTSLLYKNKEKFALFVKSGPPKGYITANFFKCFLCNAYKFTENSKETCRIDAVDRFLEILSALNSSYIFDVVQPSKIHVMRPKQTTLHKNTGCRLWPLVFSI